MLLFSLLVNLVDVGIVMLTVSRFVKYRFQNIKLSFISVCTFLAIINTAIQLKIEKTPAAILSSVVVIIALLFCFKKLKWYFALPVLIWALEMAYELFSISVICAIAHTLSPNVALSNERLIYFATFLSRLLFIISCLLLFIYKKKNLFRISKQVNIFQCLLMVTGMMLLYCLFDIFNRIISKAELPSPIAILISIIVLVFFLILVFVLFYKMQIDAKKDKEFALKEQYEIMSQDAVKQLSFMMEKILNVRHDLNKKLNIMYYLTGTNESESAIQFYDEIEHDVHKHEKLVILTDKPVIASVLLYFQNLSKNNNFKFICHVPESLTVNISLNDLSEVLMNILDNAKNAVMQLSEGRYIDFTMREQKNALHIVCRNPYIGPKKDVLHIKPTDRHGRGLKNVQTTAAHYDGFVEIKNENNIFEIQIDMFGKI